MLILNDCVLTVRLVLILIPVSEMSLILPKMLDRVSMSTRLYTDTIPHNLFLRKGTLLLLSNVLYSCVQLKTSFTAEEANLQLVLAYYSESADTQTLGIRISFGKEKVAWEHLYYY